MRPMSLEPAQLDEGIETITGRPSVGIGIRSPYGPFAFKRIVVGVDGSPQTEHAIAWSVVMGRRFGARVWVVAAVHPERTYRKGPGASQDQAAATRLFEEDVQRAFHATRQAGNRVRRAGIRVTEHVVYGDPAKALVDFAAEQGAHLIVVGSHRSTGAERALLGSVSDYVKDHADASILIARGPASLERILAPVDGSTASRRAAGLAARLGQQKESSVRLLHVEEPPRFAILMEDRLRQLPPLPESSLPESIQNVTFKVLRGDPRRVIVEEAQRQGSTLIVMGSRGLSGIKKTLLGSVSARVAHRASCSTLFVRPARPASGR